MSDREKAVDYAMVSQHRPPVYVEKSSDPIITVSTKEGKRTEWSSKVDFILSCVGYAVGLGNVWRFPYLCYKSGGGAFLIPYFLMLVVCGIPLLYMELAVGQLTRFGPVNAMKMICPMFKGVGLATVVISYLLLTYYIVIMAWAVFYLVNSFGSSLPWTDCDPAWSSSRCWSSGSNLSQPNNSVSVGEDYFQ